MRLKRFRILIKDWSRLAKSEELGLAYTVSSIIDSS